MIRNMLIAFVLSLAVAQFAIAEEMQVDVNTATAEELAEALTGVGPAKASAIIAYREKNGEFEHVDELVDVRGIGLRTLDQNRERIVIGEPEGSAEG